MAEHLKSNSRLLSRLNSEIKAASSSLDRDCKRLERVCYLTRFGNFDESQAEIVALRAAYLVKLHPAVSAWLNLAEGLVQFCTAMDYQLARAKFLRSHAISVTSGLPEICAKSAAWLAHIDYLLESRASMAKFLAEALRLSGKGNAFAKSRASLVVAQAYHYAGRLDIALPWYEQVRIIAAADGDDLTIDALIVNFAGQRVQQLRFKEWKQGCIVKDTEYALISSESAINFEQLIKTKSLTTIALIQKAQVYCSLGFYRDSLDCYSLHLESALKEGMTRWEMDYRADVAWCKLNIGEQSSATTEAIAIDDAITRSPENYNVAPVHWRLSQIFQVLEVNDRAQHHRQAASESLLTLKAVQLDVLHQLQMYEETRANTVV